MSVIATDTKRLSNLLKAELWSELGYCREVVTAYEAAAKTYAVGTTLGRVITSGIATATADAGNTGTGTFGTITVTAPAKVGKYRVVITAADTNAGTFAVIDPDGIAVGTGTVAAAYSKGGLAFTISDATDFIVGDGFTVTVAGTYKYKIAVETATDGSKEVMAVVLEDKAVAATTDTKLVVLVKGPASVAKGGLVLDATYDDATKKGVVYAALEAKGIQVLESA